MDPDPRLAAVRKRFSGTFLHQVLAVVNRACTLSRDGCLPTNVEAFQSHGSFVWCATNVARQAIFWSTPTTSPDSIILPRFPVSEWRQIEPVASTVLDIHLAAREDLGLPRAEHEQLIDWVYRYGAPQFQLQHCGFDCLGRALLMYLDAGQAWARRKGIVDPLEPQLAKVLGAPLPEFLLALTFLFGEASRHPAVTEHSHSLFGRQLGGGLFTKGALHRVKRAAIDTLRATPDELLKHALNRPRAFVRGHDEWSERSKSQASVDGYNSLIDFPLVDAFTQPRDPVLVPVPELLLRWPGEPLMHRMWAALDWRGKKSLNGAFEEYLGIYAKNAARGRLRWFHESQVMPLEKNVSVVDWVATFRDSVVMVDAKRHLLLDRHILGGEPEDFSGTLEHNLKKGVNQADIFWRGVKAGVVPSLSAHAHKQPVVIVVIYSDADIALGNHEWMAAERESLGSMVPHVWMSVARFEQVMDAWRVKDVDWLPEFLLSRAKGSRRDFATAQSFAVATFARLLGNAIEDHDLVSGR